MENARDLLVSLRNRYSQAELAEHLGVDVRTVRRWEAGDTEPPPFLADAIHYRLLARHEESGTAPADFTFIDLFAGIGGIRKAFESHGGRCVFTSEWNPFAVRTYLANFPESVDTLIGDIKAVKDASTIPDHDVLLAGFPCQPFSIAGVSKKNALGRPHGFADETQGTLFFDVARIIEAKRPAAFMLENVKNLVSHDHGHTFEVILRTLRQNLGSHYQVFWRIIDGQHFVPQHRERIMIVGFREPTDFTWDDLRLPEHGPRLHTILHPQDGSEEAEPPYTEGPKATINPKYTLTAHLWRYLRDYAARHKAEGHGFGYGLVTPDDISRTLSARYYKDGSEVLVSRGKRSRPRRLTPRECARLMGYDDDFIIPVSDTQAYKQFGNSVVVPAVREVARIMVPRVLNIIREQKEGVHQPPLLAASA